MSNNRVLIYSRNMSSIAETLLKLEIGNFYGEIFKIMCKSVIFSLK